MTALTLHPPAKLNLGLAITGRRPDGFHNLVTIFQAVDIRDTLELRVPEQAGEPSSTNMHCSDPTLATRDNIVVKAVAALRSATSCDIPIAITLRKKIPVAAGLGGASSNAAATLLGLNSVWRLGLSVGALRSIAARLGSDVPFFLSGGCALGQGRGEMLRPLPAPDMWYVVVYPKVELPFSRKTAAMFGALDPSDFGNGHDVLAQASRLDAGLPVDLAFLGNAFERPLYALVPELRGVQNALRSAGAGHVAITGAGPTHFTAVPTHHDANRIARAFESIYAEDAAVFICRTCPQ